MAYLIHSFTGAQAVTGLISSDVLELRVGGMHVRAAEILGHLVIEYEKCGRHMNGNKGDWLIEELGTIGRHLMVWTDEEMCLYNAPGGERTAPRLTGIVRGLDKGGKSPFLEQPTPVGAPPVAAPVSAWLRSVGCQDGDAITLVLAERAERQLKPEVSREDAREA
jgi:hypothetical protein